MSYYSHPLIVSIGDGICFGMSVTKRPLGGPHVYSVVEGRCAGSFPETEYQSVSASDWFWLLTRQDGLRAVGLGSRLHTCGIPGLHPLLCGEWIYMDERLQEERIPSPFATGHGIGSLPWLRAWAD